MNKISNRIITPSTTIIASIKKMDELGVKLLFVFDKSKFLGIVTIGDIQRAIIKNVSLDTPVVGILDRKKIYAKVGESIDDVKKKMYSLRAECMPVVSDEGDLVDVYFWKDLFAAKQESVREKIDLPVVIMAGGLGTRLRPITNIIPKPLIPINEKTILEIIMEQFKDVGCSKFYLSVNYKSDVIQHYIDHLDIKYDVEYFKEDRPLGTIGSVSLLRGKINTPFFVSNCDILIDQDFRDIYEYHLENKNEITIVTSVKSFNIPYGVIETGENGLLTGITEKPEIAYMINTGVYILNPELLDDIPKNEIFHITQLMEKVRNRGGQVGCFPVSEKSWTDIGDWNEYIKLINKVRNDKFRDWRNIGKNAFIGMGSNVVKDVPDNEVWAGNPAKKI